MSAVHSFLSGRLGWEDNNPCRKSLHTRMLAHFTPDRIQANLPNAPRLLGTLHSLSNKQWRFLSCHFGQPQTLKILFLQKIFCWWPIRLVDSSVPFLLPDWVDGWDSWVVEGWGPSLTHWPLLVSISQSNTPTKKFDYLNDGKWCRILMWLFDMTIIHPDLKTVINSIKS